MSDYTELVKDLEGIGNLRQDITAEAIVIHDAKVAIETLQAELAAATNALVARVDWYDEHCSILEAAQIKLQAELAAAQADNVKLRERKNYPELCMEDDGDIGIDWATADRDMLSFSLTPNGRIVFTAIMSDGRGASGTALITPLAFEVLRKLIPEEPICTS